MMQHLLIYCLGFFLFSQKIFSLAPKHSNRLNFLFNQVVSKIRDSSPQMTAKISKVLLQNNEASPSHTIQRRKQKRQEKKLKFLFGKKEQSLLNFEAQEITETISLFEEIKIVLAKKMASFFEERQPLNFSFEAEEFKEIKSFFVKIFASKIFPLLPLRKFFIERLACHLGFPIKNTIALTRIATPALQKNVQDFKTLPSLIDQILINPVFYPQLLIPPSENKDMVLTQIETASQTIVSYISKISENRMGTQSFLIDDVVYAFSILTEQSSKSAFLLFRLLKYYDEIIKSFMTKNETESSITDNLPTIEHINIINTVMTPLIYLLQKDFHGLQSDNREIYIHHINQFLQNFSLKLFQDSFFIRLHLLQRLTMDLLKHSPSKNIKNISYFFENHLLLIWKDFNLDDKKLIDFIAKTSSPSSSWIDIYKKKTALIQELPNKDKILNSQKISYFLDIIFQSYKQINLIENSKNNIEVNILSQEIRALPWKMEILQPLIFGLEKNEKIMKQFLSLFDEVFKSKKFFLIKIFLENFAFELGFKIKNDNSLMEIIDYCIQHTEEFATLEDCTNFILYNPLFYPIFINSNESNEDVMKEKLKQIEANSKKIIHYISTIFTHTMTPQKFSKEELLHSFSLLIQEGLQNKALSLRVVQYYNGLLKIFITENGKEQTGIESLDEIDNINLILLPSESYFNGDFPKTFLYFFQSWSHGYFKGAIFSRIHLTKTLTSCFLSKLSAKDLRTLVDENLFLISMELELIDHHEEVFNFLIECYRNSLPWNELKRKKEFLIKQLFDQSDKAIADKLSYLLEITFDVYKTIDLNSHENLTSQAS